MIAGAVERQQVIFATHYNNGLSPILFARVISSNVVTFCFFGDVTLTCELVEDVVSMANVDSRSSRLNGTSVGISPHTVDGSVGALSLFQKNGFNRLAGRVIFGVTGPRQAVGGGGGGGGARLAAAAATAPLDADPGL